MTRKTMRKAVCMALTVVMVTLSVAACGKDSSNANTETSAGGSGNAGSAHGGPYKDFITIDVFDAQANFQGIQSGWFGKVVKDKFNMELNIIAPNVAGGGETLYQTRSANGNLGDLIICNIDKNKLKDMASADLLYDMKDLIKDAKNLQKYQKAIEDASKLAGKDGIWAVPSQVSNQSPTEPSEVSDPTNAPSLRWDLYKQVGYPEMNTLEDLLPVLKKMQDAAGKSVSGKKVYAFSLFKDWDGDIMQNAGAFASLYGYEPVGGTALGKDDGTEIKSTLDQDGPYIRALKFLFQANQMGLVDPESTTQNYDSIAAKYTDGAVLYSLWPWLGSGYYNTSANIAEGKGFQTATIKDMKCLSYGSTPVGSMSNAIMIGSKAKDPQRLADFIDWLYSPEGIEMSSTQTGGKCGPKGLTWELKDGKPVLTDFGVKAFVDIDETLQVPSEWGTGTWKDGISALNYVAVGNVDTNEENGMCYNYQRWDDYLERTKSKLTEDWSAKNGNAKTAIEYLKKNDLILVCPGTNYATPDYSTDINTIKEQCKQTIVEYSWKMVFAKDEAEFNTLLKEMTETAKGLGYDQVYEVDKKNCQDRFAAFEEVKKASAK